MEKKIILITGHRRENIGYGFQQICKAIKRLATEYMDCLFIYPVHLNPGVKDYVEKTLSGFNNIILLKPLPYDQFIFLISRAFLIMTDSGGIQEEAPALGIPVIVMREKTERPEGIHAGCAVLGGVESESLISTFKNVVENKKIYEKMSMAKNPFGDGNSAKIIVDILNDKVNSGSLNRD